MPIYEFYCPDCHTVFNFLSRSLGSARRPACPKCKRRGLERWVSTFATPRGGKEGDEADDLPIDGSRMEQAVEALAGEAESINEDDPRQAAGLMRKFSRMTGMEFGHGMQEALDRMEAGEDPEKIEEDMGDLIDGEDPFVLPGGKRAPGKGCRRAREPRRDKKLYDL